MLNAYSEHCQASSKTWIWEIMKWNRHRKIQSSNMTTRSSLLLWCQLMPKLNPFFCAVVQEIHFPLCSFRLCTASTTFHFRIFPTIKSFCSTHNIILHAPASFDVELSRSWSSASNCYVIQYFHHKTEHRNVYKYEKGKQTHKHLTTISF